MYSSPPSRGKGDRKVDFLLHLPLLLFRHSITLCTNLLSSFSGKEESKVPLLLSPRHQPAKSPPPPPGLVFVSSPLSSPPLRRTAKWECVLRGGLLSRIRQKGLFFRFLVPFCNTHIGDFLSCVDPDKNLLVFHFFASANQADCGRVGDEDSEGSGNPFLFSSPTPNPFFPPQIRKK